MNPLVKAAADNNKAPAGYDMKAGMPAAMASKVSGGMASNADSSGSGAENTKPPAFAKLGAGTGGTTTLGQGTMNVGLKGRPESLPTSDKQIALDVNPVRQPKTPWKA